MKPKLEYVRFEPSGGHLAEHGRMWSEIMCSFSWPDREDRPSIEILVNQTRDRDATYAEFEQRAQDQAIALLREALAEIEAHGLAELNRPRTL